MAKHTELSDMLISLVHLSREQYLVELHFTQSGAQIERTPQRATATFDESTLTLLRQTSLSPAKHGRALRQALFIKPGLDAYIRQCLAKADGKLRLRIEIDPNATELVNLRWETLYNLEDTDFLAVDANCPLSRFYSSSNWEDYLLRSRENLGALVVVANPRELSQPEGYILEDPASHFILGLSKVDVEGEVARAKSALQSLKDICLLADHPGSQGRASYTQITYQLQKGCDILYLACHGAILTDDEDQSRKPFLLLENEDGTADRINGEDLANYIQNLPAEKRPRLAVLASCQSGGQGKVPTIDKSDGETNEEERSYDDGALSALGPKLAEASVLAVVAMQDNVKMETVKQFMPVFFKTLLDDSEGRVDQAIAVARNQIFANDRPDWWVPVLYSRLKDGRLFKEESTEPSLGALPPHPASKTVDPPPLIFVGRQENMQAIIDLLHLDAPPEDRKDVVAIHGMPGVGKTALMKAIAYDPKVVAALPYGVLWAELGPEPDIMSTQFVWGRELGEDLSDYPSPEARKMRLLTLLNDKNALLVLDNVWQTRAAQYLLTGGPACRTLITTRNFEVALALAGRQTYPLPPLDHEASLELLRNLTPDAFTVEPAAMEDLASRLAGLPLALNIVGQTIEWDWQTVGDISNVLKDLEDRDFLLRMTTPDKEQEDEREKHSLRAVLEVSYERLPDEARKLAFILLGAYDYQPAIFDLTAASAVWQLPVSQTQKTISILTSRALIDRLASGRYSLHALIAEFATSLLLASGPDQYLHAKHRQAIHYLDVARHYRKIDFDRWEELDRDWDNLRAIANWISNRVIKNEGDRIDLRLAASYAAALDKLIRIRKIPEAEAWLGAGIKACQQLGRLENQAWLNLSLGSIILDKGKLEDATLLFRESAQIFAGINHLAGLSYANGNLGIVARIRGDYDKAIAEYRQVLEICQMNNDNYGAAYAHYNLGDVLYVQGDRTTGQEHLEKCILYCRQEGEMENLLVLALSRLAELNLAGGLIDAARDQANEALEISTPMESSHLLGIATRVQAEIQAAIGNHDVAHSQFLESLRLLEQAGVHEELAETHELFANHLTGIGEGDAARQHYETGIQIFEEIGAHNRAELLRQQIKTNSYL